MTPRRYDLQVHTAASPCSGASPVEVVEAALGAGLDGIAITNHDTLADVDAVRSAAPPQLRVVSGVEVTTTQGHLLALGVDAVPERGDPLDVIDEVHDAGGVAVLSHPFDRLREFYDADLADIAAAVDGVEVTNSRVLRPKYNHLADGYAGEFDLARTAGSDAHFPMEVGRACTVCEGPLLESIRQGDTEVEGRGGYVSGHVATKIHEFVG